MASAHQQFKASLDVTAYEKGLSRMESETRASTARTAREFERIQTSASKRTRGERLNVGQASMQLQDVMVQLDMGTSAARVLGQQGSQLASIFGPTGMIIGGLVSMGALIWEAARAGKEAANQAEREEKARKAMAFGQAHRSAAADIQKNKDAAEILRIRAEQGDKAADAAERELKFQRELDVIRKNRKDGNLTPENAALQAGFLAARKEAEDALRFRQETRERGAERVGEIGQGILNRADQIRGKGMSKAEQNREDRAQRNAERRAIAEELDAADRKERNTPQGTGKARTTGLTEAEKERARDARKGAVDVAKDKKLQAEISQENIDKILNGIDNLLAK